MSPIPLNKSSMSSFEKLNNCDHLVRVLATRNQACETCKKPGFIDHLHFIVDEGCLLDPNEGVPALDDGHCSYCQKSLMVKVCANCSNAIYCNKSCQKSHWSQHSKKCAVTKTVSNAGSASNGTVCNGSSSIHVSTPLAQPVKTRPVTNSLEKEPVKTGKGDLVRITGDEVDKVQKLSAEVVNVQKPINKKIAKIELKSNDKFEFLLTFGSNPSNFYVQRNSDAEQAGFITECLNRKCGKLDSWEDAKTLETGHFCAALYDEDGNWYRARVLQKIEDEYHINFIDFGNPDCVKAKNLRPLPTELVDIPALAVHCKLHDLKPNTADANWSKESVSLFGSEVESLKFTHCQVYDCNKDGIYSVDLCTENGWSIAQLMIKENLATRVSGPVSNSTEKIVPSKLVSPPTQKVMKKPEAQQAPKVEEQTQQTVVKPVPVKPVDKINNAENIITPPANPVSKSAKLSLSNLRKLRKPESKIRAYVDDLEVSTKPNSAVFTSVFDKQNLKFSIMFNVDMFCEISGQLSNHFDKQACTPSNDVEVGKYVAVKADDEWHRAYVLKKGDDGYTCLFLDIGFVDIFETVYQLPPQFLEMPSLFVLATALGDSSQRALKEINCEEPIPVSILIAQKGEEILGRVKFEDSSLDCNMKLKSYVNAVKEMTESLEDQNPLDTIPTVQLDGDSQSVLVVYHEPTDLSIFYVAPDTDGMSKVMEDTPIQQRLGKPIESPKVGTYCLAKVESDDEWYRAVVVEVSGESCRVYFVDFGNEDIVSKNKLLSVDEKFSPDFVPAQAVKCILNEESRNDKNFKKISVASEGTVLNMKVISKQKNHYIVAI